MRPPQAPYNMLKEFQAKFAWEHWNRAMQRTWAAIPSLEFEVTYQDCLVLVGGWFSRPADPPLNDNRRPRP